MSGPNPTILNNITTEQIESGVMLILYAYEDTIFTAQALFNKLLQDKYSDYYTTYVPPNFKSKFLMTLYELPAKYGDHIELSKDTNGCLTIICKSDPNKECFDKYELSEYCADSKCITITNNDYSDMYNYIMELESESKNFMEWESSWNSNTIFHELVLYQNYNQIKKLIELNQFRFFVKNSLGQTPIELAVSPDILKLLIKGLECRFSQMKNNMITFEQKCKEDAEKKYTEELENKNKEIAQLNSQEHFDYIIKHTNMSKFLMTKSTQTSHILMYISLFVLIFYPSSKYSVILYCIATLYFLFGKHK